MGAGKIIGKLFYSYFEYVKSEFYESGGLVVLRWRPTYSHGQRQGRVVMVVIPHLELRGGNGAPLDVGGTLVLPLEWRQYVGDFLKATFTLNLDSDSDHQIAMVATNQ